MARIHFCPGSENLIRSIPADQLPKDSSDVAESGTRVHAALQTGDASDLDMTETEIAERLKKLEDETVKQWWSEVVVPNCKTGPELGGGVTIIREERLWIRDQDTLEELASAKPDVVYHIGDYALCVDFKSGFKPSTPAQRNHQLKTQALAVHCETYCSNIRVVIAQHRFTSMVTAADYNDETIPQAAAELMHDLWKSNQPDAPRVPGEWCDYCPAAAWCSERTALALLPSYRLLGSPKKELMAAYVESLTPEDLAFVEKRRLLAVALFDAVKARLKKLPTDQLRQLGFELSDGRTMPEVKDPGAIIHMMEETGLLKEDEVMGMFHMLLGKVEETYVKRVMEANERNGVKFDTQKAAKESFRQIVSEAGWVSYENKTEKILKPL